MGNGTSAVGLRVPWGRPEQSGLSRDARVLYRALVVRGPVSRSELAAAADACGASLTAIDELTELGLLRRAGDGAVAVSRTQLIDELLREQAEILERAFGEVAERQRRMQLLLQEGPELSPEGHLRPIVAQPEGEVMQGSRGFLGVARQELMAIHPGPRFSPEVLTQSLRRAETMTRAGVRIRVVHHAGAREQPELNRYLHSLEDLGVHVRLRDNLPFRLVMVDRRSAVCSMRARDEEDSFLVEGGQVVPLLARVFEMIWVDATPREAVPTDGMPPEAPEPVHRLPTAESEEHSALLRRYDRLTPQQQFVLRCLAAGETDRTIARRAGVTPRTVTRRIAEIYQVLEVESRFQAGVVAQRLGLV